MQNYTVPYRTICLYRSVERVVESASLFRVTSSCPKFHRERDSCLACFMHIAYTKINKYVFIEPGMYEYRLLCAVELSVLSGVEYRLMLNGIRYETYDWERFNFQLLIRNGDNAAYRSFDFNRITDKPVGFYPTDPVPVSSVLHISSARCRGQFQWNKLNPDLKFQIVEYLDCLSVYALCIAENLPTSCYKRNNCKLRRDDCIPCYVTDRIGMAKFELNLSYCFCQTTVYARKTPWDAFCMYSAMSRELCAVDRVDPFGKCLVFNRLATFTS